MALRWPDALRSLRQRDLRLFFAGQVVSLAGTWMQTVAQSWLVWRLTGSAQLLGLVGFLGQLPVFLRQKLTMGLAALGQLPAAAREAASSAKRCAWPVARRLHSASGQPALGRPRRERRRKDGSSR